jgi:very-short-patch-repair endonuclease
LTVSTQLPADGLGAWLLAARAGQAVALFGADAAVARSALVTAETAPDRRVCAVFPLDVFAPAEAVAERSAAALGTSVLAAFPYWYRSGSLAGTRLNGSGSALLDAKLSALRGTLPELSAVWARRAAALALSGRPPLVPDLPLAVGLRQLVLALNAGAVTLVPALARPPDAAEAPALAFALQWLARSSGAAVVALLPGQAAVGLERLDCAWLAVTDPPPGADGPSVSWTGPVEGHPQWNSQAEQRMAAALALDECLAPLFAFNQTVMTCRGGHPRVDLLWREGRLVVEIDGYPDHTTRIAFRQDRQRDYELAISGYLVLRLTADEVLNDLQMSLDKLRDAVMFRRKNERLDTHNDPRAEKRADPKANTGPVGTDRARGRHAGKGHAPHAEKARARWPCVHRSGQRGEVRTELPH